MSALHHIYHVFALAITSTYVLQQFIYAYLERTDMDKLSSQVMFIMLCHVTGVAKQIVFHTQADNVDDMPLYNESEQSRAALLEAEATGAARLLRAYSGCAVATCVLWIVFPILYRLQGQHFEFPFWIGIDYQHPLVFVLVLLYSFYCTNLVGIGNTTMDAFMATILLQCKTQLRILRSLSRQSISVHVQQLRWSGFCRASLPQQCSPLGRRLYRAHHVYRTLTLLLTLIYLAQECAYAYKERADMDKLARVMFLLLCHVTSLAKQFVFYVDAHKIDAMIQGLDDPLYNQPEERYRRLLASTARSARVFVRVFSGCAVLTCTLWIVFPLMYHLRGEPVEFPFWIDVDYSRTPVFVVVLAYSYYVTTLIGIANTTVDAFIATILNQCKTQLRILRWNFESLPDRTMEIMKNDIDNKYEAVLMKLFLECLMHFEKITKTTKTLQDIFGTAILIQFGIGGWILCMAAYKIVSLKMLSIEFASMTLFISCILTELFLYCYYGNEVTVESERVVESIYSMEWVHAPVSFKRSLVVVMERAKRPLRPAAGLIIPLSLETFLKIIKSSYTFYAVLRQTK